MRFSHARGLKKTIRRRSNASKNKSFIMALQLDVTSIFLLHLALSLRLDHRFNLLFSSELSLVIPFSILHLQRW